MKILYLITDLGVGGAERQVCDLADKFAEKDHQVTLVSLSDHLQNNLLPKNPNVKVIKLKMTKTLSGFVRTYLQLRQIITALKPDVVHSHMVHANLMARLLRLTCSLPKLICTAHSSNEGGKLRMLAYRFTNFLSDANTNVSQEAVESFIQKGATKPSQMFAMPNGIDTDKFIKDLALREKLRQELSISEQTYVFLAVGRLTDPKDYPNLIKAFAQVHLQAKNTLLVIAGIGELEAELKSLVAQLNLHNSVKFLGLRRDIPAIMNIADTYVLSSYYEGLPLVLGEAMSCENIIVATDCGGTKEMVQNHGFLVPKQSSDLLAEKMLYSMNLSVEERTKLGISAREHIIAHYSLTYITEKWLELYSAKVRSN
ncbi:putative UDP-galactose--lipooligosaccharide galactosyltransferase [Canicola haemoglobinophilus]|uniref:UDP-galactose--lipooligosaccharide galactosyltransferase n=1 Tax=Canicola haemoglobinophilus TaxID=733 RepID=A0AB38H8I4_9PAST|nr:glycosyltransferase [Canicola haemoglobinophilus]STO54141.1 putative UDP-galactose--lipooligosaccharide galactosyltransferase [Canicola haemoglobinophilus]STO68674.1 putative UDP-galactose--lipooligosaccharide galactosyltransferase [Canicola haemoglobinophilus]